MGFEIISSDVECNKCSHTEQPDSSAINTGQSIPIPHSEPFSHLRCENGSQTYLNL